MRRVDREIPKAEAMELLRETKAGVLAMVDSDGAPYAIPVNHALIDGALIIHCARAGRKIDCLRNDNRVCYTAYRMIHISPEKLTTKYTSAVVTGRAELVEDLEVKLDLLGRMTEVLAPGARFTCDDRTVADTGLIRIKIEGITGKANR
ncbi:MAG: pyridoxamine 5'-phosphate oxidase family protein [Firmicutes bacterium]|jgi:nitroimidazol reductase NimA-like FMN-containing flavoprotein (pyridoxamine 5'-phosphate oxidase superfamily)|nr:pyridoxamine 5'-phosphate oxidase family protein [Bacillota bacterium]